MFRELKTPKRRAIIFVMKNATHQLLLKRHFRKGSDKRPLALAGNFHAWKSPIKFILDPRVQSVLLPKIDGIIEAEDKTKLCLELELGFPVGWETTHAPDSTGRIKISKDIFLKGAVIYRSDGAFPPAPQTSHATVVIQSLGREVKGAMQFGIFEVFPGVQLGKMNGNLSDHSGRMLYPDNHPGEL